MWFDSTRRTLCPSTGLHSEEMFHNWLQFSALWRPGRTTLPHPFPKALR